MQTVFTCPTTSASLAFDIPADDATLSEYWLQPVVIICPFCAEPHVRGYRELYIRGMMSEFSCQAASIH